MSEELATLASFDRVAEAHLLRGLLESAGIDCWLADENMVGLNMLCSFVVGGVKVQVRESDYARALEVMEEQPAEECAGEDSP